MCIQIQILGVQGVQIPGEPKKKQNMLQSEQSDFEKGLIILWYVFNLHRKIPSLHSVLPWIYSKSNNCTVWYIVCFPFSSSRILIFMYSTFLCCRISLEFCVTGWGLWMIEGKQMCAQPETQEFLSNSLHLLHTAVQCNYTQIQIHPNTSHYTEIPCTGCVWRLIKCRSLLRSVLSAFVRKRALGIPFMIQTEW